MASQKFSSKEIQDRILELTNLRGPEKSICPSEVARALDPNDWRDLMPLIREQAILLREKGKILITQKNKTLEDEVRGAIRLKKP